MVTLMSIQISTHVGAEPEKGGPCPVSHYCPPGTSYPLECPAGTYNNVTGRDVCFQCPPSYFCPENITNYELYPCPQGHYCPNGTAFATQFPCPRGYFRNSSMGQSVEDCVLCPGGHYCGTEGLSYPSGLCDEGYFCVLGAWASKPTDYNNYTFDDCLCPSNATGGQCRPGYYCPTGSQEPTICREGQYCSTPGLADVTGPCRPGYFCAEGASRDDPTDAVTGDICPPGRYCGTGTTTDQEKCPLGSFSNRTGNQAASDCTPCTEGMYCGNLGLTEPSGPCDEGYFCPPGQNLSNPFPCTTGHYCPSGSIQPTHCPSGTYQDSTGQGSCKECVAGYYCDDSTDLSSVAPYPCPKGYYCPNGTKWSTQFGCPAGTYNPNTKLQTVFQCTPCDAGKYCSSSGKEAVTGDCDITFWCINGSSIPTPVDGISGDRCPEGYYCPAGTAAPDPCPVGTWSNSTGLGTASECLACSGGFYCDATGLKEPTGPCSGGFYCTQGASSSMPNDGGTTGAPCTIGHFCPPGTKVPVPCPDGTYQKSTQAETCEPCAPGHWCDGVNPPSVCPIGYYCPEGTGIVYKSCPPGTFSTATGLWDVANCTQCTGGHYCDAPSAQVVAGDCEQGYYCTEGSSSPTPETNVTGVSGPCPEGHFCPAKTITPQKCPLGTFNPNLKAIDVTSCIQCTYGQYCGEEGLGAPSGPCDEGFFCLTGAKYPNNPTLNSSGGPCPVGHYCPNGTSYPLGCKPGTYSPSTGLAQCLMCPAGYHCPENSTDFSGTECPTGHYCPEGTKDQYEYPCERGTYNNYTRKQSASDCMTCEPGHYCGSPGLTVPTDLCTEGWYCVRGAWTAKPTEIGNYTANDTSCTCPADITGGQCQPGYYCPRGSSEPLLCKPGSYCETAGLADATAPCTAGYYCTLGAIRPDPQGDATGGTCPKGAYCPEGTGDPIKCPPGTFTNATGNTQLSDCRLCTSGFYCDSYGQESPTDLCSEGYYCPEGQNTSTPTSYICTPGHLCIKGSKMEEACESGKYQDEFGKASCKDCPEGYYCDGTIQNNTVCNHGVQNPSPCEPGSFCLPGTKFAKEHRCPNGTYNDILYLKKIDECTPCPSGQYCGQEGLSSPSGFCDGGFYCLSGASVAAPIDGVTGNICQKGAYCPVGSNASTLCPPGTYNPVEGLEYLHQCKGCEGGQYCPTSGMEAPARNCTEGYFCSGNSSSATPVDNVTGNECPVGHYCPEGTAYPIACDPGTFTDVTKTKKCELCTPGYYCITGSNPDPCPAGFYCPEGTGYVWQSCPAGTFGQTTGLSTLSQCTQCTGGFYCDEANLTAVTGPCDAGFYCKYGSDSKSPTGNVTGDADVCPVGHYCTQQTQDPVPCPAGTFNNQTMIKALSECQDCLPGYFCDVPGLVYPTGLCEEGFYCAGGSISSKPATVTANGGPCPAGTFCKEGSSQPTDCPPGHYNINEMQSNCTACPAGFYCEAGAPNKTICPKGYYCPPATEFAHQFPCGNGTFNNQTQASTYDACQICPVGHYCPGEGNEEPAGLCSGGWYCALGSWTDRPSILGLDSGSDCSCPATSIGGRCNAGQFCPPGSESPQECLPGHYCEVDALANVTGECDAGHYCNVSSTLKNPVNETFGDICPKGHYCPRASSSPIACQEGEYSDWFGNHNISSCLPCTAGMYCAGPGRDLPNGDCDIGWFCPEGSIQPQPPGNKCLAGHTCPKGSGVQTPCPSGQYQPDPERGECLFCQGGTYCDQNEAITEQQSGVGAPSHGVVNPKVCPAGFYCPNGTMTARQNPCPLGTYSNTTGLESLGECRDCPAGFYCEAENITEPTGQCTAGYYCVLKSTSPTPALSVSGGPCPQGTHCVQGSSWPDPCPKGTFGDRDKLPSEADCTICPPGEFCSHSSLTAPNGSCLAGYYCSNASEEANPVGQVYGDECPAGYFCPEHSHQPTACAAGTYQPHPRRTNVSACNACDPGKYCNTTGLPAVSGECDEGFYCTLGASTPAPYDGVTGNICPAGSYCPLGSPQHFYCANGTYTNHTGAAVCYDCPDGYYCTNRDRADFCLAGYYCPYKTGADLQPCPAGTYNPVEGMSSLGQCTQCDGGKFCQTPSLSAVSGECAAGYYCRLGVDTDKPSSNHTGDGGECPQGYYCPAGTTDPLSCPPGSYSDSPRQQNCTTCPKGFYCLENSTNFTGQPCPEGYYCPAGTSSPYENPCPKGSYNPASGSDGQEDCLVCPPGQYCQTDGLAAPSGNCTAGWYCTGGAYMAEPVTTINATSLPDCTCPLTNYTGGKCWPGTYCPEGSPYPVTCDGGMYCSLYGLTQPEGLCNAGYYCSGGAVRPDIPTNICPTGFYCEKGSSTPSPCPAGMLSNTSGNMNITDCILCPPGYYCAGTANNYSTGPCSAGFYCPAGQSSPNPVDYNCTTGHKCPVGTGKPVMCAAGFYQDETQRSDCKDCPAGKYCDPAEVANTTGDSDSGVTTPAPCPPGYFCPLNTGVKTSSPCPTGTYSNETELQTTAECKPCTGGFFCENPGLTEPTDMCDSGYVCVSGAETARPTDGATGDVCDLGAYCPKGSDQAVKCPAGTFSDLTGLQNVTQCQDCPPGEYCNTEGLTHPVGNCSAGHYCPLGAVEQNPIGQTYGDYCTSGHYCPAGTGIPIPCPAGTYLPDTGRDAVDDCIDCPGGKYCELQGLSNFTGDCDAGYYCEEKAVSNTPTDGITGNICPVGTYCPVGSHLPLSCDDGTYMNHTMASACDICPPRYYCVNKDRPDPCPQGRYCEGNTGFNMSLCPAGTYNPVEMLMAEAECTACDPGHYCDTPGQVNVTGMCSAGYYCQSGVNTAAPSNNNTGFGGWCPTGHYCPEGTTDPLGCAAGTYTDVTHQDTCTPCQMGYYCLTNSSTYLDTPCPKGAYCPSGTKSAREFECPAGTYNNRTMADDMFDCLPCPGGEYCAGDGLSEPTGNCAPGWFCTGGAYTDKPSPVVNTTDTSTCPVYSLNFTGGICTPGTYCPVGSQLAQQCSLGMYCELHALEAPTGNCHAGSFCNGSAIVPNPVPCAKGHYCPEGTTVQEACPPGTFSDREGNTNLTDCLPCTAGQYCQEYGRAVPNGPCDEGYFCPEGQQVPRPTSLACSPGHFCLQGSWNESGCPSGSYQQHWQKSDCDVCPAGSYCTAIGDYEYLDDNVTSSGNYSGRYRSYRGVSIPTTCPPGSYCPEGTKFATEFLCLAGSYSNRTGLANYTQCAPCEPGRYCAGEGNTEPSGLCAAGYYCTHGAYNATPTDGSTGDICPQGRFCVNGSITGEGCPVGTFSNRTGLQADTDCTACSPGYYCGQTGLTQESGHCWAGHYCSLGAEEPAPVGKTYGDYCTAGHYCPNGTSVPEPCPPGTFQYATGTGDIDECTKCTPGSFCETYGLVNVTGPCGPGYFCTLGSNTTSPVDGIMGAICPEGHYCEEGSPGPTPCGNGTFMNHTGASACYICPEGYYCVNRDRADICRQGFYCPEGTGADLQPCPTGTFGNTTGLFEESQCTPCTGGNYCATPGSPDVDGECQAGYYCVYGVDTATPADSGGHKGSGAECPVGSYCPKGSAQPLPCAPGTHTDTQRKGSCDQCPGGYYCLSNTSDATAFPCPTGHYCPPGTEYSTQYKCQAGTYNPHTTMDSSGACLMCTPGLYCAGEGLETPSGNCSEGWFCSGGAVQSKPVTLGNFSSVDMCPCPSYNYTGGKCQPGTYCPLGSSIPVSCEAGWYCDDYELPAPKAKCDPGYFCPTGQSVANPVDFVCWAGYFCVEGSPTSVPCPIGHFSNSTGNVNVTDCKACTPGYYCDGTGLVKETGLCGAGYYCPEGQTTATPISSMCPKGMYCPEGSALPLRCERGTYQAFEGEPTCEPCLSRSYCDPGNSTVGIIDPVPCPAGYYCPTGTKYKHEFPCPSGTYSPFGDLEDQGECTSCEFGKYCKTPGLTDVEGDCLAGYFCDQGANTSTPTDGITGDICPRGKYCPIGSVDGDPCPVGTYNNLTGLRAANECIPCDPGQYCPSPGLIVPYAYCTAGYYCEYGSNEPSPKGQSYGYNCPSGHYCPEGIPAPVPCPQGTYQPSEGKQLSTSCVDCDPGKYCLEEGNNTVTGNCMAGYYCVSGAKTPNPTDGTTGAICTVGHYCPEGSHIPTQCPPAFFMNRTGAAACDPCPEGYYCTDGAKAEPCPQGYYCPQGSGSNYKSCPVGTFGGSERLSNVSQCTPCTGGFYCDSEHLTAPSGPCIAGFYCVTGVNMESPSSSVTHTGEGDVCPPGFECPLNSTFPVPCLPGSYSPSQAVPSCLPCPAGSYCLNETVTPITCPMGHYCTEGTSFDVEHPCPKGTYYNATGAKAESDCLDCPPGEYCEGLGNIIPSGLCDPGFFCAGKSFQIRPYDLGNLTNAGGSTSDLYSNDTCAPMWDCVCPDFELTSGGICPMGYYCPQGTHKPEACTPGMYCETPGLPLPTGNCSAGYYCNGTSAVPNQYVCPEGSYCIVGTSVPEPCPAGTFANKTGTSMVDDCLNCTGGMFCQGPGDIRPTDFCDPGFYCPESQTTPTPSDLVCWKGHYCEVGSSIPTMCPGGAYQPSYGASTCLPCPEGFFCNMATGNVTYIDGHPAVFPAPCPRGFYCPEGTDASQTYPCPVGTYGPDEYYSHEGNCTDCTSGYYCERTGLSTPTGECYAGYYCTGGASSPTPIYDKIDETQVANFTGNDVCPVGYFCTNGTSYPQPCPLGTFSTQKEVTGPEGCEKCWPGRYCNQKAYVISSEAPKCHAGFICIGGSTIPEPTDGVQGYQCPAGFYCEEGAVTEVGCSIGSFQPSLGQHNCTLCPAGQMCPRSNMSISEPCKMGYYCPFGSLAQPCPPGTYNNKTEMFAESHCIDCPPGHYCAGNGNIDPSGECEAGYYCEGGANSSVPTPTPTYQNNGVCPAGHYCPQGTTMRIRCPAGTIRNTTGGGAASDCRPCPGGFYCESEGQTEVSGICATGYYCPSNDTTLVPNPTSFVCPVGYFCLAGSAAPTPCPAGQYQLNEGQDFCDPCPAGSYCQSSVSGERKDCPEYHYCPEGTAYPIPCGNGTFTYDNMTKLRSQSDCLACETGQYCRNGQLYGNCTAGYYCKSGSPKTMPNETLDYDACVSDDPCAGFCPRGFYCLEGTLYPTPCPADTYRDTVGAAQENDCAPCPAGFLCPEGSADPDPCPIGFYCTLGNGTTPCPRLTFRNITGAKVITECFPCPAGFWCNHTGMANYSDYLCPPGFFCLEGDEPRLCPAGRMKALPGVDAPENCDQCRAGYYCPNDTSNTMGIPCRETYECPEGASIEIDCRPGHYCNGTTGLPPLCWPGFYCPAGTDTPILCEYPYYCPEGSNMTLTCPLGHMAEIHTGIRYDYSRSCRICPAGYYGNYTDRRQCDLCPGGYYCPIGTGHGTTNPCPIGSYCPPGSAQPTPCPTGMYGKLSRADEYGDCVPCPMNTYNNLLGQKACRPCGSSSTAAVGSAECTCNGLYRSFQESDGSCVCLSGFIYYNEVDRQNSLSNGNEDCQQIVDGRCSQYETRQANTRQCVTPESYDCSTSCPDSNGVFHVDLGRCQCNVYTDSDEICNQQCRQDTSPTVTGELTAEGYIQVSIVDPLSGNVTITPLRDTYGPLETSVGPKTIIVATIFADRVTASLFRDSSEAADLFKTPQEVLAGTTSSRRRLLATTVPTNQISNPAICLELDDMVMFKIWLNDTDRTKSHYPVYQKDHLYNTNPTFDYGAFTQMASLVTNTNVTVTTFAHVFTEAGIFVFSDSQEPDSEIIITVKAAGTTCPNGVSRILPSTPANIAAMGVYKQSVANEAPDWGLIIGLIAFFGACVVLLIVAVLVWKPRDSIIYPMKHWKPKYRSLGAPPPVPSYMRYDVDHWPEKCGGGHLGPRPSGDGAEISSGSSVDFRKDHELEDFNVRVLYDKLEDQNLHMASQLARQQEDLRGFYSRISAQNDELKKLLNNLDPDKLADLERRQQNRGGRMEREGLQQGASDGPTVVNANINMGSHNKYKFGHTRESELMSALQLLLDKLNSGNIPMSREMWERMQRGEAGDSTSKFNINRTGGAQTTQDQAELLRRQNGEKMELERDLEKDEKEALDNILQDQDAKRRGIMDGLSQALAVKLQGDLKDSEVKDILSNHDRDLEAALATHNKERDRYLDGLRHKLAERRKQRESMLREKHQREAEQAGLPKPVDGADDLDIKLKTEQELMNTLHSEEMAGSAKSESDAVPAISDIHRKKMSKGIKQKLKSLGDEKLVQEELVDRLLQSQLEQEAQLQQKMRNWQQQQIETTRRKMADRRRQRLNNLRDKQEREMAELSTKVIQGGNPEQLDRLKKSLDEQHRQEREAAEAELDAQENEQIRQATLAIDEDHTVSLKDIHRDILKQINKHTLPGQELAVQRMLEDYKQELASLDMEMTSEKNRQLSDIQARIATRRARRLRDAQRRMEESAAQKFVEEQTLQMKQAGSGTGETPGADLHHMPEVKYGESIQEQALKKEQQRAKEELRKRQKQDREQLGTKLEQEATGQEQDLRNNLDSEREKILHERKNKLAAEAAARSDLSQEQLAALLASHQQELDDLADRLDTERDRQQLAMREKMAHRRKRKMDQLRRKQEAEMTQEMLEQKKEVDEIKLKQAKAVEQKAIEEGIRQNGQEDSDKVIKAVLANRHAQELRDLESQFDAKKKVIVDGALSKLHDKYDNERDAMLKRHQDELHELQNQGLGPQELQDRRADLLNRQQMELSDLDRRLAADEKEIERGALADWEVQFARAQLDLKEKHYKEFAEALKRYSPENEDAGQAEMAAEELEEVKQRLDDQRREQEERLKKEQKEFEKAEKKRLESEMEEYARQLEEETKRDKEKHEKNIHSLNKRKEDLVKERKQKMQEELERLKNDGASKSEQERIMQQHDKDLQSLLNKMEADRLRMNTSLQERIKKRKEEKLKKKEQEVKDNLREEKRDLESRQRSERDRLKTDEMLTLQETLNIDLLSRQDPVGSSAPPPQEMTPLTSAPVSQPETLPETYNMAAPLNEAELMSLLMASPLYKKLESMKQTLADGGKSSTPAPGDTSLDSRDADWMNDKELQPVDLNKVTSRSFIVYKFGCFVADLVGRHCHHAPVTILLADKIPANEHLTGNLYRNSFHFDANNRILYLRSARLDSVGEFILVMVHCLAHVKSGDLRDDANPAFVKEYQRALTVICDDLFFARFNRSSSALSKSNTGSDLAAEKMLQNLFNNHHNEDGKSRVVEDLLEVKLLPSVDSQGLRFTQDRIEDRLSKYSNFSMTNKLQSMLGSVKDKMVQADAQGATPAVNRRIRELSQKYSTAGTTVLNRHVPPSFMMANMTGTALYNTVFNSMGNQGETTPTTDDTKDNTQDKYDNLCADFAEVNQNILKVSENIGALETEITAEMELAEKGGSKDRGKHDSLRKAASGKLTQAKSDLAKLEMDKKRILDLISDNEPRLEPDTE